MYDSVVEQRKRAALRVTEDKVRVRQADFEERRMELQRYLIQQRRSNELNTSRGGNNRGSGTASDIPVSEPPPYREQDGHLFARKRYIRGQGGSRLQTTSSSGGDGNSDSLAAGATLKWSARDLLSPLMWLRLLRYRLAMVPTKYWWIGLVLVIMNARRFALLLFGDLNSPAAAAGTPFPLGEAPLPPSDGEL